MKISLNWLREFVDIPQNSSAKYLANLFTTKVAEVEKVIDESAAWKNIYVGQVLEINPHPNADKLRLAKVSLGKIGAITVVCGGNNLKEKMFTVVALPGAFVKWHGEGELVKLEPTEIRGIKSEGMICAKEEIGLEEETQPEGGIADLSALKLTPGAPLAEALDKKDIIFEIENKSLTHRPDLWGHYGIAREFAAILDKKLKPYITRPNIPKSGRSGMEIIVKNQKLCPRYCGVIIENIKVDSSPAWLVQKLKTIGRGAHNNIVDITNYVTEEIGQPLHAFDINNISEKIIVRTAEEGEKITTLDEKEQKLSRDMLVIADAKHPLAIAGIMGGIDSGITKNTKTILVESANFDATSIRKTSMRLGLRTDSSQRFEKSLDPDLAETGIKRAIELILKICPEAHIASPITDIKNFNAKPIKIDLSVLRAESIIGAKIGITEMIKILKKLEFEATKKSKDVISATIPSFRATKDVDIEEDLIEEISRMHGYDKIPALLPELPTKLPIENLERKLKYSARDILSFGLGFTETQCYSFYGLDEIKRAKLPAQLHLQLDNYLSSDQTHLRISLIPNMLKAVKRNIYSFDEFKIYEIGRTYINIADYFPLEEKYICGLVVKNKKSIGAGENPTKEIFYSAKGALEAFLKTFGAPNLTAKKTTEHHFYVNPSKQLTYLCDGEEIAKVFEIHPAVLKNFGLEEVNIGCFEINFSKLTRLDAQNKKYKPIPKFPGIKIDVSVVMPEKKSVENIINIIKNADAELIADVELFDIFTGKSIGPEKRALAFKIALRSNKRTLTLEDMNKIQKEIFEKLKSKGGIIRGL